MVELFYVSKFLEEYSVSAIISEFSLLLISKKEWVYIYCDRTIAITLVTAYMGKIVVVKYKHGDLRNYKLCNEIGQIRYKLSH